MAKLVIVESPAKAKTIKKYLGRGYRVVASMGHVRDLPKSKLGVDIEHHFEPQYINIKGKGELIKTLKKEAKNSDEVFLASDPDREGEAIAWHLSNLLALDESAANRVTFHEMTKSGVKSGMANRRQIDRNLVNAQQARRILDRIVGYQLSPFLWRKVRRGLSAGRVQSVTVRMIVDREEEIRAFTPEEYWTLDAVLLAEGGSFSARFYGKDGKKLPVSNQAESDALLQKLRQAAYTVGGVKKGMRKKSPAPPFSTSTLQQEASRKLGFQAARTMRAAQELYEGVDVAGMGAVGLITYMRTDSLRISAEAQSAASAYIANRYGEAYLPERPRQYKSRGNAQDAHEAIRPTMPDLTPDQLKDTLTADQYKLYRLIWSRFIASQMANAVYDTVNADILADGYLFKASGHTVRFDGYTVLYEEGKDEEKEDGGALPELKKGDALTLRELTGNQHFTQPPARFTEATLIKTMEENGIGRPSTYAPTITTIVQRNYVEREGRSLKPTALGEVTTKLMKEHFSRIVDEEFTARMEKELDEVELGKQDWVAMLEQFYDGFSDDLQKAEEEMKDTRVKVPDEETDEVCELCGRKMVIKIGRFGPFLACPGFPECKNTRRIVQDTGGVCPKCGKRILVRRSKKGKTYYGCEDNPRCDFMTWDRPIKEKCPNCGGTLLKKDGRNARIYCANEDCGYQRKPEPPKPEEAE